MSAEVSDTGRTESDQPDELGDASPVAEGKAESATEGVRPSTGESTCAGSGAESLEETFGSSASKEYTFGSSHSVQMASGTPGSPNASGAGRSPNASGAGLPPKPKLPPLGAKPKSSGSPVKRMPIPERRPRSPKGTLSGDSQKLSAGRSKSGDEDDDEGCEFTFGHSAPIQLPDFSQLKASPSFSEETGSLRQAGNLGEEKPHSALATVQEGPEKPSNDRPPPPTLPPPAIHRPLPPQGVQPPWVSPRTGTPGTAISPRMAVSPRTAVSPRMAVPSPRTASPRLPGWPPQIPGQMPPTQMQQMYAYNAAAVAQQQVAVAQQAAAQQQAVAVAQQQAVAQQVAAAQIAAAHQAQMQQAQVQQAFSETQRSLDPGAYGDSDGQDADGQGEIEHVEAAEEEPVSDPPVSIKCAYWIEMACSEIAACKFCQLRAFLGCACVLLFVIGAVAIISIAPSGVQET